MIPRRPIPRRPIPRRLTRRRLTRRLGVGLLLLASASSVAWGVAWGASANNQARAESDTTPLVIEAALDRQVFEPVLKAFAAENPRIRLDYRDRSTLTVDARARDTRHPPDVVISSAMPWQMALSNEGRAQPLDLPEASEWPAWAKWRDEVFGFTFEPIVMAYRLELASHMPPPTTHRDLLALLTDYRARLAGRVVTYSPRASGVGYTLFQQDARYTPRAWELIGAMQSADVKLEPTTRGMLEGLSAGRYWLGYNLLGSYAMVWAQTHPNIIVQVPNDYSLVLMRMAFVHRDAPHPELAKRFVAFLLSRRGQHLLAGETPLFSVRDDVIGPYTAQRLRDQVGDHLYPIPINATLLAFVDSLRRKTFLERWDRLPTRARIHDPKRDKSHGQSGDPSRNRSNGRNHDPGDDQGLDQSRDQSRNPSPTTKPGLIERQ